MKHNILLEEPQDRVKLVVLLTLCFKYISQKTKLRFCYTAKYINSFSHATVMPQKNSAKQSRPLHLKASEIREVLKQRQERKKE